MVTNDSTPTLSPDAETHRNPVHASAQASSAGKSKSKTGTAGTAKACRDFDRAAGDILRDAIKARGRKPSGEELAQKAKEAEEADRREHPAKYLIDADVRAIESRLHAAAYGLLAIHRLCADADEDLDREGFYTIAIEQLARSAFKGLDACIARLTHRDYGPLGNFEGEFDEPMPARNPVPLPNGVRRNTCSPNN